MVGWANSYYHIDSLQILAKCVLKLYFNNNIVEFINLKLKFIIII